MKTLVAVMLLVGVSTAGGQTSTGGDTDYNVGISAGVGARASSLDGTLAALGTIHGAITVDHETVIGIEAVAVVSEPVLDAPSVQDPRVAHIVYGGLLFERVFAHRSPIHPMVRLLVGGGGAARDENGEPAGRSPLADMPDELQVEFDPSSNVDAFFVVEPGLAVEFVLTPTLRVELAALYRIVTGVTLNGFGNRTLMGPSAAITLKTGIF